MKDFHGKVAVVTGGASGIGRALAERSARLRMSVVLADVEERALELAAREMRADGADVLAVRTDVSVADDVRALADRAYETYGAVHLLFNNAGVSAGTTLWQNTLADWRWVMGVNLWGVIHGIHYFVPRMLAEDAEGHIVNTASSAGLNSGSGLGIYRVTKHGVVSLSETLACDLAAAGSKLKASVLCPDWVKTNLQDADRNRPTRSADAQGEGAEDDAAEADTPELCIETEVALDAAADEGRKLIDGGIDPAVVAEKVFDAIRGGTFYILTHPGTEDVVRLRADDILLGRHPTDTTTLYGLSAFTVGRGRPKRTGAAT